MEQSTDQELMSMVLQKNTRALRILYARHETNIYNFIARYTGNRQIAQDLLQETFTRVWFAAHLFDQTGGNFRGWLYTIALNIASSFPFVLAYTVVIYWVFRGKVELGEHSY